MPCGRGERGCHGGARRPPSAPAAAALSRHPRPRPAAHTGRWEPQLVPRAAAFSLWLWAPSDRGGGRADPVLPGAAAWSMQSLARRRAGLTSAQGRKGGCVDRADRVHRAGGSGDPRGSPWPHFGKRAPSGVPPPASASWAQFCALRMLLVPAVPTQPVLPLVRPPDSAAAGVLPAPLGAGVLLSPGQSGGVPGWYLCPACLPPRPGGRSSQRMPMEGAADLVTSTSEAGQRVSGAGACVGASALPRGVCRTQRRGAAGIRAAGRGSPWGVGGHTLALPVPEGSEGGRGTTDWQGQATTPLTPGGLVGAGGHSVGAGVPV